jgi:small subunit ribosomal protein S16
MLKIKLQRTGRKHEPTFRLLLTDSKNSTKTGKFLEVLGSHDFRKDNTEIKKDRVLYWMKNGVKPTPTVHNLLVTHKIIEDKKINVQPRRTPKAKKSK